MNTVLYEASLAFNESDWIPVLMLIIIPLFPKIIEMWHEYKCTDFDEKFVKNFCRVAFICVAVLSIILGICKINMYTRTIGAYKKGDYMVVEGYVEDFIPMPYHGKSEESFEINGVKFSYSDYMVQYGYHNSKSHGGVITGNGQRLKIGYVYYNEQYGNIIVYIEEIREA